MLDIDLLLNKYKKKIIIVDKKKSTLENIKKFVDVKEITIGVLTNTHLSLSVENAKNSIYKTENYTIELHLYIVIQNEKSQEYYKNIQSDTSYMAYFKEKTIYIIADNTIGIIETNSDLLMRHVKIEEGITQKNINEKNIYLIDYLSTFDSFSSL